MLSALWALVASIPSGRCCTYGDLGRVLPNPASGRMVGRWMASCPEGIPWWRVVNLQGDLPISRRDPMLGLEQRQLLEREGIPFLTDGRVDLAQCRFELDELLALEISDGSFPGVP